MYSPFTPRREYIQDGTIKVDEWCCVCGCDVPNCPNGFWMPICRVCKNGPITGTEEKFGVCKDHCSSAWNHTTDCRSCNDLGAGGICTHCGKLHTATILEPRRCLQCGKYSKGPFDDYCEIHPTEDDDPFEEEFIYG